MRNGARERQQGIEVMREEGKDKRKERKLWKSKQ